MAPKQMVLTVVNEDDLHDLTKCVDCGEETIQLACCFEEYCFQCTDAENPTSNCDDCEALHCYDCGQLTQCIVCLNWYCSDCEHDRCTENPSTASSESSSEEESEIDDNDETGN
eukprot:CFRG6792T1